MKTKTKNAGGEEHLKNTVMATPRKEPAALLAGSAAAYEQPATPEEDVTFHRALALPPTWQLAGNGAGHVLEPAAAVESPASPFHQAGDAGRESWPKQTLLSEAYPPGARTPLRRSPSPDHQPPLPNPDIAMQFHDQQQKQSDVFNPGGAHGSLLFEQNAAAAAAAAAPTAATAAAAAAMSPAVPELAVFQAQVPVSAGQGSVQGKLWHRFAHCAPLLLFLFLLFASYFFAWFPSHPFLFFFFFFSFLTCNNILLSMIVISSYHRWSLLLCMVSMVRIVSLQFAF